MANQIHQFLIRRHQVEQRTGLSRSSIYALMDQGKFPKAVQIGPRAVGWVESEIDAWIFERIAARAA